LDAQVGTVTNNSGTNVEERTGVGEPA
jgi:hypothetical protein